MRVDRLIEQIDAALDLARALRDAVRLGLIEVVGGDLVVTGLGRARLTDVGMFEPQKLIG